MHLVLYQHLPNIYKYGEKQEWLLFKKIHTKLQDKGATCLFENEAQMGIPTATRAQLQQEGISTIQDLLDFYPEDIKQVAETLCKPGG